MNPPGELDHLTDEQLVFINCAQDILAVTPGAQWQLITELEQLVNCRTAAFAAFIIDSNPAHDLSVSIELGERAIAIVINGNVFTQRRKDVHSFERWIDRCCRLLTRMTEGDLKLTVNRIAGTPQRATLFVRPHKTWHELIKSESHAASVLSWVLPFGIGIALSGEQEAEFPDWANALEVPGDDDADGDEISDDRSSDVV